MLTLEQRNELINQVLHLIQSGETELPKNIDLLLPLDWALALESTATQFRQSMWLAIPEDQRAAVLNSLREETCHVLLQELEQQQILAATQQASTEEAVNVIAHLPQDVADQVVSNMIVVEDVSAIKAAMEYSQEQVGRFAERDVFTLSDKLTVVEAKLALKEREDKEWHHYVFLTNSRGLYVGKVKAINLWQSNDTELLANLAVNEDEFILATNTVDELAAIFKRLDVEQLPVVDLEGRIVGSFNAHNAIVHIENYYEAKLAHAGNVSDEDLFAPVMTSAKQRAIWLGINLMTAILAAQVIGAFEATLNAIVALAVLMPIVASMGGIAGSQTLTLTIRGLATNQLSATNIGLLRNKEFKVILLNAVLWAITVGVIAQFWFENISLSVILAIAVIVNMVITVLFGIAIPYVMHKLKIDPALAGSVVLTTISDVVGFFVFLGLATLWLL